MTYSNLWRRQAICTCRCLVQLRVYYQILFTDQPGLDTSVGNNCRPHFALCKVYLDQEYNPILKPKFKRFEQRYTTFNKAYEGGLSSMQAPLE